MKLWRIKIHFIAKEIFQYSLLTYLILFLTEMIKQGLVSFFFNLNILLFIVLLSSIIMVLTNNERLEKELKSKDIFKLNILNVGYIIIFTASGGFFVWYETQDLGVVSIIISVISAILIVLFSFLIFFDSK